VYNLYIICLDVILFQHQRECFKRRQKLPDISSEVGLVIIRGLV